MCNRIKDARVYLKYLCTKTLQRNENNLDPITEERERENLLQVLRSRTGKSGGNEILYDGFHKQNRGPNKEMKTILIPLLKKGKEKIFYKFLEVEQENIVYKY